MTAIHGPCYVFTVRGQTYTVYSQHVANRLCRLHNVDYEFHPGDCARCGEQLQGHEYAEISLSKPPSIRGVHALVHVACLLPGEDVA